MAENIQEIHIVFDKYLPNSIKGQTRKKRGSQHRQESKYHISQDIVVPLNWK